MSTTSVASADDPVATFQAVDRFNSFATIAVGPPGNVGDPITLTWSVVPDGTTIDPALEGESSNPSNLISMLNTEFGSSATWLPLITDAFDRWSELSGITFIYEPNDDMQPIGTGNHPGVSGVRGDIRLSGHLINGPGGTLAYNYFPDRADMVIDTADGSFFDNTSNNFRGFRNTLMHELGHGLGFAHVISSGSGGGAFLMEPFISTSFDGPQLDDILAAHRNYGDVNEKGGGNDNFSSATSLGFIGDLQTVSVGTDAGDTVVGENDIDFISIDDDSDVDYFSFTVATASEVDLTLTPMGPTYNEAPQTDPSTPQSPLVTSELSNLSLEIFDTNGTSTLGFSNSGGLGDPESLNDVFLDEAGTYFVAITGDANNVQLYQLDVSVVAVPEPWSVSLGLIAFCALAGFAWRRRLQR